MAALATKRKSVKVTGKFKRKAKAGAKVRSKFGPRRKLKKPAPPKKKRGGQRKSNEDHILEGTLRSYHLDDPPKIDTKPVLSRLPTLRETRKWIRSEADERAVANGCRYSERMATFVVEWFRKYLKLSEGSQWAGKPFELMDWQRDDVIFPIFGWVRVNRRGRIVRRIRKVYAHVPKKSGKSPLGAAIGTFMWAGDGESGANVFTLATDKDQAGIVHRHAIHMVEDSPELSANTKINRSTRIMVFTPTRSPYAVKSGKSSEGKSIEGLNAHAIIADELHAWVGFDFYGRIINAFRGRAEPLFFQITTAGDNTDSVCFQQYEYAKGVISGEIQDDRFLGVIYEADRDADILDEAQWKKANPSLGHLFEIEDMRADALEASKTARGTSTFKRYLLNIWCTAENPWLDADKWKGCYEDFSEEDLVGHPCWGALDLAKTLDMTAFGKIFKDPNVDGVFRQIVEFFMPEETFEARKHLAPYEQWLQDGWLTLTPGGECDYSIIESKIAEDHERFNLQKLFYDKWQSVHLTQRLEEHQGIERVEFQPTINQYAEPTKEYERLIMQGNLRHNGNAILAWQASHVTTWEDRNQGIRPVKRKRGDHRTIDGIVVGIMALSGALIGQEPEQKATITKLW